MGPRLGCDRRGCRRPKCRPARAPGGPCRYPGPTEAGPGHAVTDDPGGASDSAAPAAPAGHRRSEPESESDSESGADRPGAGSGESATGRLPSGPGPGPGPRCNVCSSLINRRPVEIRLANGTILRDILAARPLGRWVRAGACCNSPRSLINSGPGELRLSKGRGPSRQLNLNVLKSHSHDSC
jgi:hypothetical protein